jgi:hypothetical protein
LTDAWADFLVGQAEASPAKKVKEAPADGAGAPAAE